MKRLVIASHNLGKLIELKELLAIPGIDILCLKDFPWIGDIEETGQTLYENAFIKAQAATELTGLPSIGDDSGVELYALDMFPGIYSARCAGENASDAERMELILEKMRGIANRRAQFRCVLCFMESKTAQPVYFEGITYGNILESPLGISKPSLPFDSIFFHVALNKTFAEATQAEKDLVSHRGRAAREAKEWLEKNL